MDRTSGRRMVIIGLNDICRIFADYCGRVGFPSDAMPVKFMFNSQEKKLAIVIESDEFSGPQVSEDVKFDIRRIFSMGGGE